MMSLEWVAILFCAIATLAHVLTTFLAIWRLSRTRAPRGAFGDAVSIIRPVCGLDPYDKLTLRSTFDVDYPAFEIIFCAAHATDAAVPFIRSLIAEHPHVPARLLIGDERPTPNPKLNNIAKGWRAARHAWVVIADSNVLMPQSYVDDLLGSWRQNTGLVCAPPIASRPRGFSAMLECAFLNTYQARWQYAADAIGFGFAQGKSMLWRRDDLNAAGGILALGSEIAEDAAATKVVREQGKTVRLADCTFEQPIGQRDFKQVWDRQVRWARLRRATFPAFYAPEVLTGSALPIAAGVIGAPALSIDPVSMLAGLTAIWFGAEALLARRAGWHLTAHSPAAWIARDLLLPVLWVEALTGNDFNWRGNDMTIATSAASLESKA